jgi:hypothetical protein
MVEGRGGEELYSFRTRTGANSIAWWKGGVGRSCTPLAHVPEPIVLHGGRTGEKERCSLRTQAGAILYVGGRTGWKRPVFFVVCAHVPEQKICIKEGRVEKNGGLFAHEPYRSYCTRDTCRNQTSFFSEE